MTDLANGGATTFELGEYSSEAQVIQKLASLANDPGTDIETARAALHEAAEVLRAQSGRQATLRTLYETATEIIDVHESGVVLKAAIDRARALIGSDLAYLALLDEQSRGTRVKVTVGTISPGYGSLHVPLGAGMGGKVSQLRTPFWTPDYLTDDRIIHVPSVDEGILAEGVRGMLAVPLIAHNEFLGGLFVADRRKRHYTKDEINHLQALAAVIAVALDNARLFEREEESLKQMEMTYESLNARLMATERELLIHQRMNSVLDRDGTLEDLASVVSEEFGASANFVFAPEYAPPNDEPDENVYAAKVGRNSSLLLSVKAHRPLNGTDRRLLERVAQAAEALLLRKKLDSAEKGLIGAALFHRLVSGDLTVRDVIEREGMVGLDLLKPCAFIAFKSVGQQPANMPLIAMEALGSRPCLVGQFEGLAVALISSDQGFDQQQLQVDTNRLAGGPVALGVAFCDEPATKAVKSVREAAASAELLIALRKAGDPSVSIHVSAEARLLGSASPQDSGAFIAAVLGPVIEYDKGKSGGLLTTIRAYFDVGMNATKAAEELGIHPKTMAQRMDRIAKIGGVNWKDGRQLFRMQIALLLFGMTEG